MPRRLLLASLATLSILIVGLVVPSARLAAQPAPSALDEARTLVDEARRGAATGRRSVQRATLTLYSTAETEGKLAEPRCRQSRPLSPDQLPFARQVGRWKALVDDADARGHLPPVALHLGDAIFPNALGRYLLSQGRRGHRRLAELLGEIPWTGMTPGNQELGAPAAAVDAFARIATETGLPIGAANIGCADEVTGGLCSAASGADSTRILERGPLSIGVVSLVDPQLRQLIAPSRAARFAIASPSETLETELEALQQRGPPDLTVVQYHASDRSGLGTTADLATRPGVDVVVTNQPLDPARKGGDNGYLYWVTPKTGTYVVGAGRGASRGAITTLQLARRPQGDWQIQGLDSEIVDATSHPPDAGTADALRSAAEAFCRDWGRPVAGGAPLKHPFEREDFVTWALNVMRFTAGAEVALANEGAFLNSGNFPIPDDLTLADVHTILPYANPLTVLKVSGASLQGLKAKLGDGVVAAGLEVRDDQMYVNGRPLVDGRTYSVATNRFVARGGDGVVDPESLEDQRIWQPRPDRPPPTIADLLIRWVESGRYARMGAVTDRLAPRGNFPDLARKLLWTLRGSLNASYDKVSVYNPQRQGEPAYENSQLNVKATDQINAEADLSADADSRNHGWDNNLKLQYATARVANGEVPSFEETKDLIRGKSRYKYTGLRANVGGKWWAPIPTAELQVESEFDPADGRDRRKVELTGILGSTFRLFEPFELKIGADIRRDLRQLDGKTVFGLATAYQLERTSLADVLGSPIQFESEVEYFFNDIGRSRLHELRSTSRLYYAVFGRLNFTATFSAYLFRSKAVGAFGRNTELLLGLNYLWEHSVQTY